MNLPLPNTHIATLQIDGQDVKVWGASEIKAYVQQCREAALEEVVSAIEFANAERFIFIADTPEIIRSLK